MDFLYFFIDFFKSFVELNFMQPYLVLFLVGLLFAIFFKLGDYDNDRY